MTRHLPEFLVSMPPQPSDPEERLAIATELLRQVEARINSMGPSPWSRPILHKRISEFLDDEFAEMGVDRRKAYDLEDS